MLPTQTHISRLALSVSDLARSLAFYQQILGFQVHRQEGKTAYLGAGDRDLLILEENSQALPVQADRGMYHFAVLVPNRRTLAQVLLNFIQSKTPLQGMSDHLVSEAIYLGDPDGHGIEIYADRPRQNWDYLPNGEVIMATQALDYHNLLGELDDSSAHFSGLPASTMIGHMHMFVDEMMTNETFYREVLGWRLMTRYNWAMAFLAAGGYHHHVGIRLGRGKADPRHLGLLWYGIALPDENARETVAARLRGEGVLVQAHPDGLYFQDPAKNGLVLTV